MESSPPKSFLETLADAIKAPASLFYKENKQPSKSGDVESFAVKRSRGPSTSPKKSVRFRAGNSVAKAEPRSSPIDIPKPTPSLPPVQLATTPLLQCFAKIPTDPIPTARPQKLQVLKSSAEFREAITAAQYSATLQDFEPTDTIQSPPSNPPTPLPGTNAPMDDPFDELSDEVDLETTKSMLTEYDGRFQCRKPPTCSSTDVVIENKFVSNDEKVQDLNSSLPATMTEWRARQKKASELSSPTGNNLEIAPKSGPEIAASTLNEDEVVQGLSILRLTDHRRASDGPFTDENNTFPLTPPEIRSPVSKIYNVDSELTDELRNRSDEPLLGGGDRNNNSDRKCHLIPAHEDKRRQFKRYDAGSSSKSRDRGSPASDNNTRLIEERSSTTTIDPSPEFLGGFNNIKAVSLQSWEAESTNKRVPEVSEIQDEISDYSKIKEVNTEFP